MQNKAIDEILESQRNFFRSGATKNPAFRKKFLDRLYETIDQKQDEIASALYRDLNKSDFEAYMTETGMVLSDLNHIRKATLRWSQNHYKLSSLMQAPAISLIKPEPYGNVLIMAPWNYPFQLSMEPLVGAIAAGNTAIVKPSNYAPATSAVIKEILTEVFPSEYVSVVEGGRAENEDLLNQRFDYIFFTGGAKVGQIVLEKAAKHLTPVSLELGGKSPVIVDRSARLDIAAKRIVFGKYLNSGQTCVAPDYLMVDEAVEEPLLELIRLYITRLYGEHPLENPNYPKMINAHHFERVKNLITPEEIYAGGNSDPNSQKIEPTVLRHVKKDAPIMQEEIFGPVLPVMTYKYLEQAIDYIQSGEKPLALYLFTENEKVADKVLTDISFGGGCVNDTIIHLASSHLPFGGVGNSGMGGYHGKYSFDTFSHEKSIVKRATWFDFPFRFPDKQNSFALKLLKKVFR